MLATAKSVDFFKKDLTLMLLKIVGRLINASTLLQQFIWHIFLTGFEI